MTTIKTIRGEAAKRAEGVTIGVTRQAQTWSSGAGRIASDPTPVYAVVGVTDAVVERARAAGEVVARLGRQLSPQALSQQVEAAPSVAMDEVAGRVGQLQQGYQGLATRGQGLVGRVRGQQATKDLMAQVDNAVMQGRRLLTTARKGATDTQSAARATVTTGRRQAADVTADVIAGEEMMTTPASRTAAKASPRKTSTRKPAARKAATTRAATTKAASKSASPKTTTKSAASKSPGTKGTASPSASKRSSTTATRTKPATSTAAKRTVTTATNRSADTATAAKAAATSVSKTAEQAAEAATEAADKVGD
ncbi:MAG: hypothetical protein M3519_07325 [Actinomycetota bacterium]|nr:hypothetical protein [Actinomycetota bacterium]